MECENFPYRELAENLMIVAHGFGNLPFNEPEILGLYEHGAQARDFYDEARMRALEGYAHIETCEFHERYFDAYVRGHPFDEQRIIHIGMRLISREIRGS